MTTPATGPDGRPDADLPYRPCVGIALFNKFGRVFVGRRTGSGGGSEADQAWQMPQGGIDPGESPLRAAFRELHEETNVREGSVTLLAESDGWLSYDLPDELLKRSWKGRYRGQTQKWFAFGFIGHDREIDIVGPGGGTHPPEFDAWRWEPLEATPGLIIAFKRPVYEAVAAAFSGLTAWRATA